MKFYCSKQRFFYMKQNPKINFNDYGFTHIEENDKKYLLHESGDKWLVATQISEITPEIAAVDLILAPTDEIELSLFSHTQLQVLRIRGTYWSKLSWEMPPQIGQLVNLQYLQVSLSSEQIPTEIGQLKKLKHLTIMGFLKILPDSLGDLQSIEALYLETPLLKNLPLSFKKLTRLKKLEISLESFQKEFITPFFENLCALTVIEKLRIEDDFKITTLPAAFSNLKNLTQLEFTYCNFKTIPKVIFNLKNLKYLDFSYCDYITVIPPDIKRLVNLEQLLMTECGINSLPPEIGALSNLIELNVGDERTNQPFMVIPREIGQLKKLKKFFTASPITSLPKEILDCESLEICRFGIKGKNKWTQHAELDIPKQEVKGNVIPLV